MYDCNEYNVKKYIETFNCILRNMITGMMCVSPSDSISHDFILQMIPHHRAAIQMSKNILKYTDDSKIQKISLNIISEQTKSIANMQKVLHRCNCYKNSGDEVLKYQIKFQNIATEMYYKMSHAKITDCINYNFLTEMIPHHEGAILMSENTLDYDICPELKPILEAIIISQCNGVKEMEILL